MKKVLSLIFSIALVLSLANVCFAATADKAPAENSSQNYNVTAVCPWKGISTRGVNPPTEGWNVHTQGKYAFSGNAAYSTLYLSKLLYGATYYNVQVTNHSGSNTLTVNPYDGIPTAPFTVKPNSSTPDPYVFMQKSGTQYFCLSFNPPSNFSGEVREFIYQ